MAVRRTPRARTKRTRAATARAPRKANTRKATPRKASPSRKPARPRPDLPARPARKARQVGKPRTPPAKTKLARLAQPKRTRRPKTFGDHAAGDRVLALDVSSRCVGWSLFVGGQLERHGRYVIPGAAGVHGERLVRFGGWLAHMLGRHTPTHLIYERPYSGRMRNTFGILSRYAGVVEAEHFRHFEVELPEEHAVPARDIKKLIGARKGADHEQNKKIVLLLINEVFGLSLAYKTNDRTKKVSQDDEADAIALNWAWHLRYRNGDGPDAGDGGDDEEDA